MAEETTPQAAPEQDAPQADETQQIEEITQEAAAEAPKANNPEDFLKDFDWHHLRRRNRRNRRQTIRRIRSTSS